MNFDARQMAKDSWFSCFFYGHGLSLPQEWWQSNKSEDGKYLFQKASKSLTDVFSSGIIIDPLKFNKSSENEGQTRKIAETFLQMEKGTNSNPAASLIIVNTQSANLYCVRTVIGGRIVKLRCNIVGVSMVISSIGTWDTEKQIEEILSTFQ